MRQKKTHMCQFLGGSPNPSHMCQILSGSGAAHAAPYVSFSLEERPRRYNLIKLLGSIFACFKIAFNVPSGISLLCLGIVVNLIVFLLYHIS